MTHQRLLAIARVVAVLAAVGWVFSSPAYAQGQYQFQVLHGFGAPGDGAAPGGQLVFDARGNLYGAALGGGANEDGMIFELSPGANGQWTEASLYSFCSLPQCADGAWPTGVIIDATGNLYGTTTIGGVTSQCIDGCGTAFELIPGANGQWTESTLWTFCSLPDCADGGEPGFAPTLGPAGVLYGTAGRTAYELTPGSGGWTFDVLYTFCSLPNCADGTGPVGSLSLDAGGNLYGETQNGGTGCNYYPGCGVVFTLRPRPNGQWQEVVLRDFELNADGQSGGVTLHDHALYATTEDGGGFGCFGLGCGTVFELTRDPAVTTGTHAQFLHQFGRNQAQGNSPTGAVEFDSRGDMFGVTSEGGQDGYGIVYGMKPKSDGKWAFGVLHTFKGPDGEMPTYGLTIDGKGNLYGTTFAGGPNNAGVVFELSPVTQAN